jgi:hypothetical protein
VSSIVGQVAAPAIVRQQEALFSKARPDECACRRQQTSGVALSSLYVVQAHSSISALRYF